MTKHNRCRIIEMRNAQVLAVFSALLTLGAQTAHAQTETVLYRFQGAPDGAVPLGTPVLDKQGNLFGTTWYGGTYGLGTVWKVTPSGAETVLWSFGRKGNRRRRSDGASPTGLSKDNNGDFYGVTAIGGTYGGGTVFKIKPSGRETILWNFLGIDGTGPIGGVVWDESGNLFGTTYGGGSHNGGTVFELTPSGTETVLWSFGGNATDGISPTGAVLNANGTLYGTTAQGGKFYHGTVWELSPSGTERVLYDFNTSDPNGWQPNGNLEMDTNGNLYGTASFGGPYGPSASYGTVFKLAPSGELTVLHGFNGTDGMYPYGNVVLSKGNLYGTTYAGGAYNGGTVWEITRSGDFKTLWNLGNATDGKMSRSSVALDRNGNVYGTTAYGGGTDCQLDNQTGCGTVFKVTP